MASRRLISMACLGMALAGCGGYSHVRAMRGGSFEVTMWSCPMAGDDQRTTPPCTKDGSLDPDKTDTAAFSLPPETCKIGAIDILNAGSSSPKVIVRCETTPANHD